MIPDLTLRSDLLFLISDQLDTNINTILNNDTRSADIRSTHLHQHDSLD